MLSSSRTRRGRAVPSPQKQRLPPPGAELLLNEHCIEEQAHYRVSLRTGPSTISYHVRSRQGKHKHGRTKQLPLASREPWWGGTSRSWRCFGRFQDALSVYSHQSGQESTRVP